MNFYPNQLFHVYNQGNNRQQIFYSDENYRFFIWKMKGYILPFADIIAYCLMPTHYHWLLYVRNERIERGVLRQHADQIEYLRRIEKYGESAIPVQDRNRKADKDSIISLNESIGIIQMGYTRAINAEHGWSGSLFRKEFKSKDGRSDELQVDYAATCFDYIHENPVKAGIVNSQIEYEYSSANDYVGMRKETICNLELGKSLMASGRAFEAPPELPQSH